jgi:hypothetical protein
MNQKGDGVAKATAETASTEADAKSTLGVVSSGLLPLLLPEFSESTIVRLQIQGERYPAKANLENFKSGPAGFKAALWNRRMRRTKIERGQALAASHTPPKSELDRIRALIAKVQVYKAAGPGGINPRTLTRHQVDAIIVYFTARQPDVTCPAIADLLDRTVKEIRTKRARLVRADAAVMMPDLNTQNIYADMTFVKQTAQDMALAAHDYEAFWDIEREYREELVSLGLLEAAPKRIDIRDIRINLTEQMAEFMHEFGTPSPKELIARLRGILPAAGGPTSSAAPGNGNGNGDRDVLAFPVRPVNPAGGPREPEKDGSADPGRR